jgi:hypothetical protein
VAIMTTGPRPLTATQTAIMLRLCAETGLDGYAATLIVADVGERSWESPYFELVRPTLAAMAAEEAEQFRRWAEAEAEELARGTQALGEALATALTPVLRAAVEAFHDLGAALEPRRHRDRCRSCNQRGNPGPLAVNGHEYRRRSLARKRRKGGR